MATEGRFCGVGSKKKHFIETDLRVYSVETTNFDKAENFLLYIASVVITSHFKSGFLIRKWKLLSFVHVCTLNIIYIRLKWIPFPDCSLPL